MSRKQLWRDKYLLMRSSRWYYQQCREVRNETKGKGRNTQGFSKLGVREGMDSYKKDNRRENSMTARRIRKGAVLVARTRKKK